MSDEPVTIEREVLYSRILAATLAGGAASLVMLMIWSALSFLQGSSLALPIRLEAATLIGDTAFLPNALFFTVFLGLISSLILGSVLGAILGTIVQTRKHSTLFAAAAFYSIAATAFLLYVFYPTGTINLPMTVRADNLSFLLGHLGWGLVTSALLLRWEQKLNWKDFKMSSWRLR